MFQRMIKKNAEKHVWEGNMLRGANQNAVVGSSCDETDGKMIRHRVRVRVRDRVSFPVNCRLLGKGLLQKFKQKVCLHHSLKVQCVLSPH